MPWAVWKSRSAYASQDVSYHDEKSVEIVQLQLEVKIVFVGMFSIYIRCLFWLQVSMSASFSTNRRISGGSVVQVVSNLHL